MKKFVFVLLACLISACVANKTPLKAIPMSTVEVQLAEGATPVQVTEIFPPEEQEAPPPKLPELTEDEYLDAFWRVASCYEFHIPYDNHADSVRLVTYEPCLLTGFEQVMNGLPEPTIKTHTLTLQSIRPGIFRVRPGVTLELHPEKRYSVPQFCVEPSAVGGTFPESTPYSKQCVVLPGDNNKYSFVTQAYLYFLIRELREEVPQNTP